MFRLFGTLCELEVELALAVWVMVILARAWRDRFH